MIDLVTVSRCTTPSNSGGGSAPGAIERQCAAQNVRPRIHAFRRPDRRMEVTVGGHLLKGAIDRPWCEMRKPRGASGGHTLVTNFSARSVIAVNGRTPMRGRLAGQRAVRHRAISAVTAKRTVQVPPPTRTKVRPSRAGSFVTLGRAPNDGAPMRGPHQVDHFRVAPSGSQRPASPTS